MLKVVIKKKLGEEKGQQHVDCFQSIDKVKWYVSCVCGVTGAAFFQHIMTNLNWAEYDVRIIWVLADLHNTAETFSGSVHTANMQDSTKKKKKIMVK